LSIDYTLYSSTDRTEVTFDEIIGRDAIVKGDLLAGGKVGMAVQHFNNNRSYGDFRPPYRSHAIGFGAALGTAEYNSSTITLKKYLNWLNPQ